MYEAKILKDSLSPDGVRLTTFQVTFPRFILAEINTHRVFSRNSASSRAIPVAKGIEMVETDPFIPEAFGVNQPGMVAYTSVDQTVNKRARYIWLAAARDAIKHAQALDDIGIHKAWANRLLEPFKWHTALITSTEWSNFFALRTDENAQPEFQIVAKKMQTLYNGMEPTLLDYDYWHLPLVSSDEIEEAMGLCDDHFDDPYERLKAVSVGRCARVSYLTHDGVRDPDKDVELHNSLKTNGHLSPFEHVATPIHPSDRGVPHDQGGGWPAQAWSGNFRGWHQYRADIPNQDDFSKVIA